MVLCVLKHSGEDAGVQEPRNGLWEAVFSLVRLKLSPPFHIFCLIFDVFCNGSF